MSETTDYGERLEELRALPENWDSYDGKPGDPDVLEALRVFLAAVSAGDVSLVPLPDGGVQIECVAGGFEVEIEFEPALEGQPYPSIHGCWERR